MRFGTAKLWLAIACLTCASFLATEIAAGPTGGLFVEGAPGPAPGLPPSLAELVEDVSASVVVLHAVSRQNPRQVLRGTGIVLSDEGYIVTSSALTGAGRQLRAHFRDGSDVPLLPVNQDPNTRVALFEIPAGVPAPKLIPVPLGDSSASRVGEWVLALGQSDGDIPTVAKGLLAGWKGRATGESALGSRQMQVDMPMLSSYAGGPIVDMRGRLIGMISTAESDRAVRRLGLGAILGSGPLALAVPVNDLRESVLRMLERREPPRVQLGVLVDPTRQAGLEKSGVRVDSVKPYSAAAAAGVQAEDILLEFADARLSSFDDLIAAVARTQPGQNIRLLVERAGSPLQLQVAMATDRTLMPQSGSTWGFGFAELDSELSNRFSLRPVKRGIVVTEVDQTGPAARAGLQLGDLILEANRRTLGGNLQQLQQALAAPELLLLVERDGSTRFFLLSY